jgi:hypothetical protein
VFVGDNTLDRIRGERVFQSFLAAQHDIWQRFKKLAE